MGKNRKLEFIEPEPYDGMYHDRNSIRRVDFNREIFHSTYRNISLQMVKKELHANMRATGYLAGIALRTALNEGRLHPVEFGRTLKHILMTTHQKYYRYDACSRCETTGVIAAAGKTEMATCLHAHDIETHPSTDLIQWSLMLYPQMTPANSIIAATTVNWIDEWLEEYTPQD